MRYGDASDCTAADIYNASSSVTGMLDSDRWSTRSLVYGMFLKIRMRKKTLATLKEGLA